TTATATAATTTRAERRSFRQRTGRRGTVPPLHPLRFTAPRISSWPWSAVQAFGRQRTASARRRRACRPAHGAQLAALAAAAEAGVAAVGLQPGDPRGGGHVDGLQHLAGPRIDAPEVALVAIPGAVPHRAVDPGDAGGEAVGLDAAQALARFGIDLMDLAALVVAHPQRALGPGESRVAAARGRRNGRQHAARLRVDLLNPVLADLKQLLAVEGGACMRRDVERAHDLAAVGIERVQLVAGREPHRPAVEGHARHLVDAGKGAVLTDDFG